MLDSCDTFVALPDSTKGGQTLFAKNSDRTSDECQPLVQVPRAHHEPGSTVSCQFLELPQVEVTLGHLGSRPYWCWGYEHGVNEHQVVIGNEALASKFPEFQDHKLTGMDLVRLGLERGKTAAEAVDVLTSVISQYGQGLFVNAPGWRMYDNGFIVADPREAYVIETAGHEWVVKRVDSALGISNVHSVGTDWYRLSPSAETVAVKQGWWRPDSGRFDFAQAYCDYPAKEPGRGLQRRARSCTVLDQKNGSVDVRTMMALAGDHSIGDSPGEPFQGTIPDTRSICMHYGDNVEGNTAAGLVADLCADGSRLPVYWCCFYSPCLGVYLPTFLEGRVPTVLSIGDEEASDDSPWWLFRKISAAVRNGSQIDEDAVSAVRTGWAGLQNELLRSAYDMAREAKELMDAGARDRATEMLTEYMRLNTDKALRTAREFLSRHGSTVAVP